MLQSPCSKPKDKVKFVAEVSSNHNQDIERCLAFIDKTAEIGCDAVKFQLFKIEELFAPEILSKSEEHRKREAWELPLSFLPKFSERCKERNIKFGCTPFYLNAVDELYQYVDFYKIASYELLWNDLLTSCAKTGKPVVISTGMATLDEVKSAVDILVKAKCKDLTILHCVSGYPTPINECNRNLAAIETLRSSLSAMRHALRSMLSAPSPKLYAPCFSVGWSDHSVNPGVIYRAIHRWGADMIEFHLDLDGTGEEYKTGYSVLIGKQKNPLVPEIPLAIEEDKYLAEKTVEDVLQFFGKKLKDARRKYRSFVEKGIKHGRRADLQGGGLVRSAGGDTSLLSPKSNEDRELSDERILGSGDFVACVIQDKNELAEKRLEKKIPLYELIRLISDFLGIKKSEVFSRSRKRIIGKARALIAYYSIYEMGYKGAEVGRALKIKGPSVSQCIERGRILVDTEPEMYQKLIN